MLNGVRTKLLEDNIEKYANNSIIVVENQVILDYYIFEKIMNKKKSIPKPIQWLQLILSAPGVFFKAIVNNFPAELFGNALRRWYYCRKFYAYGEDSTIHDGCVIYYPELIQIGAHSHIGRYSDLNPGPGTSDPPSIIIGDYAFIGPYSYFRSANHRFEDPDVLFIKQGHDEKKIIIGSDVYIGAYCVFLGGSEIGDHCVIAAGSVVSGKIPSYAVAGGNPCRVIRFRK